MSRNLKRLLFKIFRPSSLRIVDYIASYPSQWADGGAPKEDVDKKFDKDQIKKLLKDGHLTIDDESLGIVVGDYRPKRDVYNLTLKSQPIANSDKTKNASTGHKQQNFLWWLMGIVGSIIAGLILAYVFGVGE